MIGPDATVTLDFALARLTGVVKNMLVYPEAMQANLDQLGGLVHSQQVLLALTQKGASREDSYVMVQRNAMKVWAEGLSYLSLLRKMKISPSICLMMIWNICLIWNNIFVHVNTIFERVFGKFQQTES